MSKTQFSFGKISPTPTPSSWSQAYNAGALFVVLSLHIAERNATEEPLAGVGKQFLNELEAEFFTLEEKNLSEISSALEKVVANVSETIQTTVILTYIKDEILYVLLIGQGSIIFKRENKIGTLLTSDTSSRTIHSASGTLLPQDSVFLTTKAFRTVVSDEKIQEALSLSDTEGVTEALSPHVHKAEEGNACAIIFKLEGESLQEDHHGTTPPTSPIDQEQKPLAEEITPNQSLHDTHVPSTAQLNPYDGLENSNEHPSLNDSENTQREEKRLRLPKAFSLAFITRLSHRKKVFLSIALILIIVLVASIFFTVSNQQASERQMLFNEIYPEAEKNVEEAEGIISLNKIQARRELEEAETLLTTADGKFPAGSDEYKQTEALKEKIASLLLQLGESVEVEAKEVSADDNLLMTSLIPGGRIAVVEDETSVYYLTEDEIGSIRKASKSETELVENDGDWDKPMGFGKFGSNFYVLDQSNGIVKLVPSGSDYAASDYLIEEVSLSTATSMAIDASIYVLFKNGDIKKFTRGAEEKFEITELANPLTSPTQIFTTEDMENIYVLEPKASRIVKLTKSGQFVEEYLSSSLENAKGFSISPDEDTAYVLSSGKIYSLSL